MGPLGVQGGPRFWLRQDHYVHDVLVVPQKLTLGCYGCEQFTQSFQHLCFPGDSFTEREAAARQVPFSTQNLPGHDVFGILLSTLGERAKSLHGAIWHLGVAARVADIKIIAL
jgi:hypothetical protein